MVKATIALLAAAAALALPAAYAVTSKPSAATIAQKLLTQANSGPDGTITRRVNCTPSSKAHGPFACELESVRSTSLGARVAVVPGGLRTTWTPLQG